MATKGREYLMRTIFTLTDLKNIIDNIFNGNLWASKFSKGKIAYNNPNSEKVLLIDEDNGNQKEVDLAQYLNIEFYKWKDRLVSVDEQNYRYDFDEEQQRLSVLEDWVKSLNFSMNQAYALVEKTDSEVVASQDIDSATIMGRITFLIQTDKVNNLDYYVSKIKNAFLGNPQDIQNSYGDIIKAYILLGDLNYDQEPFMTPLGETVVVTSNFRISYLANALTYNDTEIQISLDGDDLYDANGNIVDAEGNSTDTKYLTMPITKATWQNIFTTTPITTQNRPDLTGFLAQALSTAKTLSFFDFNKPLTMKFNDLFWRCGCVRYDGKIEDVKDVNIPVYFRVISNGHSYVFKDVIDNMQKVLINNDFNISSITTKGWGKITQDLPPII